MNLSATTWYNGHTGCGNTLYNLLNNVWYYVMNKLSLSEFPFIKANSSSISRRKSLFGVGINDANYIAQPTVNGVRIVCPFYRAWAGMIKRCYSDSHQKAHPSYYDCTVVDVWHSFMTFRDWMITQDWQSKELDKDVLIPGNKIYSPDTCVFITQEINKLLNKQVAKRGESPQGVSWDKASKKFTASIRANSEIKYLGRFNTEQEAHSVASKAKAEHIISVAQTQPEPIKSGLLRHAALFMDTANA